MRTNKWLRTGPQGHCCGRSGIQLQTGRLSGGGANSGPANDPGGKMHWGGLACVAATFAMIAMMSGCHHNVASTPPPPHQTATGGANDSQEGQGNGAAGAPAPKKAEKAAVATPAPPPPPAAGGANEGRKAQGNGAIGLEALKAELAQTIATPPAPPPPPQEATGAANEGQKAAGNNSKGGRKSPRASLADYVPCRFTNDAEAVLRKGEIPDQDGAPLTSVNAQAKGESLDVGCSESIMSWEEARLAFGRKIADTYIAFQVNTKNTNPDQEFLIHDLQVAVAAFTTNPAKQVAVAAPTTNPDKRKTHPPAPYYPYACEVPAVSSKPEYYTHFMAGRDKLLVRGVGQVGQDLTKRNITQHVLEAVADILGGTAAVAGTAEFSSAVHIFSATGVPGFSKVLPDHFAQQIDLLNDTGFSANSTYRIIIPKNGSATMTTFMPAAVFATNYRGWKQCELLNFANSAIVVMSGKHIQEVNDQATLKQLNCPVKEDYLDLSQASGGNLQCQISGTDLQLLTAVRLKNDEDEKDQTTLDGKPSLSGSTTSGTVTFSVDKLSALAGERYRAYVEGDKGEAATNTRFNIPPTASAGTTTCDKSKVCTVQVSGNHLDLVTALLLLKSSDGPELLEGSWSSSSKTSGTATFTPDQIKGLDNADYVLGLKTKDGTKLPSDAKVTLTGK